MPADPLLSLPPDADLDQFLRSLKQATDANVPAPLADQQDSYLPNAHQGNTAGSDEPAPVAGSVAHDLAAPVADQVSSTTAAPTREADVSTAIHQNRAPTDITVSGATVLESAAAGTVVAQLATVDATDTFTYTLTDPSGNFELVG